MRRLWLKISLFIHFRKNLNRKGVTRPACPTTGFQGNVLSKVLFSDMRFRGPTLFTSLLGAELLVSLRNEVFLADVFLWS